MVLSVAEKTGIPGTPGQWSGSGSPRIEGSEAPVSSAMQARADEDCNVPEPCRLEGAEE